MSTPPAEGRPLRVLQSFRRPRPTTNPYIVMLGRSIERTGGLELRLFSFRTALLGRYDVFHVHWPEILVDGHSPVKKLGRQVLTALVLLRLRLTRTALVRTVHNLELPSGIGRRERALLRLFDRWTTLRIRLNSATVPTADPTDVTILHGHYRDWFAGVPRAAPVPGRVTYVGLIRRYKGVEGLIETFAAVDDPGLSLHVAGKPSTPELRATVEGLAAADPRVSTHLDFLDDAELVHAVTSAELVALPYHFMHNSGATLTALSLDRPVLVPDTLVNRALAAEVGAGWVHLIEGELTPSRLAEAVRDARSASRSEHPDLDQRSWVSAGAAHGAAYRRAVELARRRRLSSWRMVDHKVDRSERRIP